MRQAQHLFSRFTDSIVVKSHVPGYRTIAIFSVLLLLCIRILYAGVPAFAAESVIVEAAEWKHYGIDLPEARKWVRAGIPYPGWANQWKGEGFSPEEAGKWKDITNVYTAGEYHRYGFSAAEAKTWLDNGVKSALRAKEYRESGMSAEEGGGFWKLGLYPRDVRVWRDAGFSPQETLEWRFGPKDIPYFHTEETSYSRQVYPLEWAIQWRKAGFAPAEARKANKFGVAPDEAIMWKKAGFSFNEMITWRDSGFDVAGALKWRESGLGAAEAEKRRDEAEGITGDEIPEFHCDINLNKDGKVDVSLNIEIINRPGGAYADTFFIPFPDTITLRYRGSHILDASPAYRVIYAEIDGVRADYFVGKGVLSVGKKGVPLTNGRHRIRIDYTTDDRIIPFADHDELFFSVIENNQDVKILRTSATVRLPAGAQIIFADGYAGLEGRKDFTVSVEETEFGDFARYEVTRPLRNKMQFLVSVAFLKGYVNRGITDRVMSVDRRNGKIFSSLSLFFSGLMITFGYYVFAWRKVGRDPEGGPVLIAYEPPDKMGPAELRCFYTQGKTDGLSTLSVILHLAMSGWIRISEGEGIYRIQKAQGRGLECSPAEGIFLDQILSGTGGLVVGLRQSSKSIGGAERVLRSSLKNDFRGYFRTNSRYLWPGIALSILFVLLSMSVLDLDNMGKNRVFRIIYFCSMMFLFGGMGVVFRFLLRSPTEAGVKLLGRIRGYRLFLEPGFRNAAEKGGALPPSLEKHLPYAVALGIDCRKIMIRHGQGGWYSGRSEWFSVMDFSASVTKNR